MNNRGYEAVTVEEEGHWNSRYRLTKAQELIWLGQQLNPRSPLYNMAHVFTFHTDLDWALFRDAFKLFVDKSDAFRSVVDLKNGTATMAVLATVDFPLEFVDLSTADNPSSAADEWIYERARRVFDLSTCLFDSALIKVGAEHFVWYLNQHHLITDAWSTTLVFEIVTDLYGNLVSGGGKEPLKFPPYRDYVDFESSRRNSKARRRTRAFWSEILRQSPPGPLRLYGVGIPETETETVRLSINLGPERSTALRTIASEKAVRSLTPHLSRFNLLATALFAYLYRVTGQSVITIGTPTHNRVTGDFKRTPGLFSEVLPLRVEVSGSETFSELLESVKEATSGLVRHAVPGIVDPELARSFNVVFNYIHATLPSDPSVSAGSAWIHPGHGDPHQPLRIQVHDFRGSGSIQIDFDLSTTAFGKTLREGIPSHFIRMLDTTLQDREQKVSAPRLLNQPEYDRLVVDFNDTATNELPTVTIAELFEQQVRETPNRVAVRFGDAALTYEELDRKANRLARFLVDRGIEPGDRVGLFLSRSPRLVVAMLASLKTGAAYVPISVDDPGLRASLILEDADVAVLLTESRFRDDFSHLERPLVFLDLVGSELGQTGNDSPTQRPTVSSPAYVVYTSGSTGKPKGVVVSHRALANYVTWAINEYGEGLTFPLFSSISFDLTVTSIFVPILSGGCIVVYEGSGSSMDLSIFDVIQDDRVDAIKLTPSHIRLVQSENVVESGVELLIVGGEDFKRPLAESARRLFGAGTRIVNEYGPAEATVGTVFHEFDDKVDRETSVPIGGPIANTRVYVLDPHGNPVPQGVEGELFIAGPSLADGYWRRPELTETRFVADLTDPDRLMYRTGDLVRLNERSEIQYIGRIDRQVKISSARVELGEIERVLQEYPDVTACTAHAFVRSQPTTASSVLRCVRCGLPETYPDVAFDDAGICSVCRSFERYKDRTESYFGSIQDLRRILEAQRQGRSDYDCLVLLSGGKDSTYALARLEDMGLRILAFTLDNGYISDEAKRNIDRVVEELSVDHIYGQTPAMDEIFLDSLQRHSNVCNGCFKTIYTLSLQTAHDRHIPFIVTGLSRGQLFETRLTEELFTDPDIDSERIDLTVLDARKAYHRVDDAVRRLLDVSMFEGDEIFEEVRFVDFYRYCDVDLDEVYAYLDERLPWVRPSDTGRSTNCLINDVGIFIHKKERGFHNYALPYSWDVRLGHKTRSDAIAELDDDIDPRAVRTILDEIGYQEGLGQDASSVRLAAYYVSKRPVPVESLRGFLARRLPEFMIPSHLVRLDELPISSSGKVDYDALPAPTDQRPNLRTRFIAPRTEAERDLAEIWERVIGIQNIGVYDNFFDLGGDSIMAIQIASQFTHHGSVLKPGQVFEFQTIAELAASAAPNRVGEASHGQLEGAFRLTPIQEWFFCLDIPNRNAWNYSLVFDLDVPLDEDAFRNLVDRLLAHHDALRLRFGKAGANWVQHLGPETPDVEIRVEDLTGLDREHHRLRREGIEEALHRSIDIEAGRLLAAALCLGDYGDQIVLVAHQLVTDSDSLSILAEDLHSLIKGGPLPPKTTSLMSWSKTLGEASDSGLFRDELDYWATVVDTQAARIPSAVSGSHTGHETRTVIAELDQEETRRLFVEAAEVLRVRPHELLLAATAIALTEHGGSDVVRLDVEGRGREEINADVSFSRSVGWFRSLYPVKLTLGSAEHSSGVLRKVKEHLRRTPQNGIGFGVLRYLDQEDVRSRLIPDGPTQVLFKYVGRMWTSTSPSAVIRLAEPIDLHRDPNAVRPYAIEIAASVFKSRLRMQWSYSVKIDSEERITALSNRTIDLLRRYLYLDVATVSDTVVASDFPAAGLDEEKLMKLKQLLKGRE